MTFKDHWPHDLGDLAERPLTFITILIFMPRMESFTIPCVYPLLYLRMESFTIPCVYPLLYLRDHWSRDLNGLAERCLTFLLRIVNISTLTLVAIARISDLKRCHYL